MSLFLGYKPNKNLGMFVIRNKVFLMEVLPSSQNIENYYYIGPILNL